MTQICGFKNANASNINGTPSGTQYNLNHGYKVNKNKNKNKNNCLLITDKLFHNSLHTQKPYTQLDIKHCHQYGGKHIALTLSII